MVHPVKIPPSFSCKRLFLNLAHFQRAAKRRHKFPPRRRGVRDCVQRPSCWVAGQRAVLGREPETRFWPQHLKVLRDCWKCRPHCVLSVLLIFLGHHLRLCRESLKRFILNFFQALKWKYICILYNESVFTCVSMCIRVQALFSLSFCFTILSSGLCPCNCKMTFETPVITFKSKTGERAVFLLFLLYQESKSLLRNSYNRLPPGVISQNLVTWLPMATKKVEKVANRMVSVALNQLWAITRWNMLLFKQNQASVSKAEGGQWLLNGQ